MSIGGIGVTGGIGFEFGRLTIVVERAVEGGYTACVVELLGCYTQGETLREVLVNIHEAILLYTENGV